MGKNSVDRGFVERDLSDEEFWASDEYQDESSDSDSTTTESDESMRDSSDERDDEQDDDDEDPDIQQEPNHLMEADNEELNEGDLSLIDELSEAHKARLHNSPGKSLRKRRQIIYYPALQKLTDSTESSPSSDEASVNNNIHWKDERTQRKTVEPTSSSDNDGTEFIIVQCQKEFAKRVRSDKQEISTKAFTLEISILREARIEIGKDKLENHKLLVKRLSNFIRTLEKDYKKMSFASIEKARVKLSSLTSDVRKAESQNLRIIKTRMLENLDAFLTQFTPLSMARELKSLCQKGDSTNQRVLNALAEIDHFVRIALFNRSGPKHQLMERRKTRRIISLDRNRAVRGEDLEMAEAPSSPAVEADELQILTSFQARGHREQLSEVLRKRFENSSSSATNLPRKRYIDLTLESDERAHKRSLHFTSPSKIRPGILPPIREKYQRRRII